MVNDGSTDGSADIARKFEERHVNFRLINQSNQGAAAARNTGLENARCSYIAFLDGDDLAIEDAYEKLTDTAQSTGACQVRCAYAEFDHFDTEKVEIRRNFDQYTVIEIAPEKFKHYLEKRIENVVWDGIYKRSLFRDIRFPEGVDYEDHHIIPRLLGETERLVYLPEPLICYRKRPASVTTSANPEFEADKVRSVNELSEVLKRYGLYEVLLPLFSVYLFSFVLHYHQKLIGRHPFRLRKGRFSVADLLDEEIVNDVIESGGLDKNSRIQLKLLLKSHFIYFFSQKKGAVFKELMQGKKTSASFSSKQKREMTAAKNTDVARYIRSFS
jgi:glycosyltransferase involved in cell wall biosynthesis